MTIAKAGERVTCANGHHICTVARDIKPGEVQRRDDFKDWQQPEPLMGTMLPIKCDICGEPYIRPDAICVEGSWRSIAAFANAETEEFAPGHYSIRGTKIIWRR